jgi:hypothetical protein
MGKVKYYVYYKFKYATEWTPLLLPSATCTTSLFLDLVQANEELFHYDHVCLAPEHAQYEHEICCNAQVILYRVPRYMRIYGSVYRKPPPCLPTHGVPAKIYRQLPRGPNPQELERHRQEAGKLFKSCGYYDFF